MNRMLHDKEGRRGGRRRWMRVALGMGALLGAGQWQGIGQRPAAARSPAVPDSIGDLVWRERMLAAFGTNLWLRAAHHDEAQVDAGLDEAVATLRRIERVMSLFDPDSAVSALNRDGHLDDPPPALVHVLKQARLVSSASSGAFDVTVQPLWRTWDAAAHAGRLPTPFELQTSLALVDWSAVSVAAERISLERPGMAITLNGIAQGYAADMASRVLRRHGIEHGLIDTGEWVPLGQAPDHEAWTLGIENPRKSDDLIARIVTDGRAVATSSDAHYVFSADRRYHHILDPGSGASPTDLSSVTVLADSCTLADALTKVIFVAGSRDAIRIARHWRVDTLVVDKLGRASASPGLRML